MDVVRPGPQYRQDPHIWDDPLTPGGAEYPYNHLRPKKQVSRWDPGQESLSSKSVFRQSRWAAYIGRETIQTMLSVSSSFSYSHNLPNTLLMKPIRNSGFNADFFSSTSDNPQQALILLGGSEGGNSWSNHVEYINQFVGLGYVVLSLAYFGADGLPPYLRAIPTEYITKAFRWLSTQKEVLPDKFVLLGVSRGAELALLAGSIYHEIKAVVAIAPSSVIFPGPPIGIFDVLHGQHSAWSLQGDEVAFVSLPYSWTTLRGMVTGKRTRMFEEALLNIKAVEAASIPVEKIKGPILIESFKQDQIWPSTAMADQIVGRLDEKDFRYFYKHTSHDTTHSNWSFEPCWSNILSFLKEYRAV